MLKAVIVLALTATLSGSADQPIEAQLLPAPLAIICVKPAKALFDHLRGRKWREVPVWRGLASGSNMVQLWTAKNSWTITIEMVAVPDMACVLWEGDTHEFLKAIRGEQT